MKVKITEDSKKILTLDLMPKVREIIRDMREDDYMTEYCQRAVRLVSPWSDAEILKADASIMKNSRVWDYYSNGSKDLDIWIECYGFVPLEGFYRIGFYLSDIWELGNDNKEEIKSHFYIDAYKKGN